MIADNTRILHTSDKTMLVARQVNGADDGTSKERTDGWIELVSIRFSDTGNASDVRAKMIMLSPIAQQLLIGLITDMAKEKTRNEGN